MTKRCAGPSRREFLQLGALGLGGLSLAQWFQAQSLAKEKSSGKSFIFIWLPGGPPHMEMYDMKPNAPLDYRGDFNPIATNVPGLDVCELFPLHAKIADKYNIVRSIAHDFADHGGGHKRFMTGRIPKSPVDTVNDAPAVGSIVAKMYEERQLGIPNYVSGTDPGRDGIDVFAMGASYLGPAYAPFSVPGDPSDKRFRVPNLSPTFTGSAEGTAEVTGRLDDRNRLLGSFDRFRAEIDLSGRMKSIDRFREQALNLITSDRARIAFDLSREPDSLRDRYGRHAWGQRCLLARRLVEAGCLFVTMVLENPYQSGVSWLKEGTYNWDSHAVNCHLFNDAKVRFPIYDQAITALVEDLHNRGLTDDVLLVVTGEFGRTPRINSQTGTQTGQMQPGRDHWPQSMSLLTCGGGMETGQVIGSTNSKGEYPQDRALTPNDLWATVYRHLGIDPEQTFPDHNGRPMPILPFGAPISELT